MMSASIVQSELDGEIPRKFSSFTSEDFVNWLDTGFRRYQAPSPTETPFTFASLYIRQFETAVLGLGEVYRRFVPDDKRLLFRKAVGEALLRGVADTDFPAQAISSLIDLIGEIKAVESLWLVPRAVFAGRQARERPELQYEAIAVFKQLMPDTNAISALQELVSTEGFNCRFTFDALVTLCRYDSGNWLVHVANLSSRISQLYSEAQKFDLQQDDSRNRVAVDQVRHAHGRFIDDFARLVPTNLICQGIEDLEAMSTNSIIEIGAGSYDRCVELLRKFREPDRPYEMVSGFFPTRNKKKAYTIRLSITQGTNEERDAVANVSKTFKKELFGRPLSLRDDRILVGPERSSQYSKLRENLSNRRAIKAEESALEEHEYTSTI